MEKHLPPIEVMPDITTPVIDIQDLEHNTGELPELDLAKEGKEGCQPADHGKIYTSPPADKK